LCPSSAGVDCHLDELHTQPATTGRCAEITVYVPSGEKHVEAETGLAGVTGEAPVIYCRNMQLNDQWEQMGLVASSDDGPAEKDSSYWGCWPSYTWRDGKCQRRNRFLGESCWDGWWNPFIGASGTCAGSDTSYDEYSTSCYNSVCIPYAAAQEREECTCATLGWNFLVVCSAAGGQCDGHACVLSTGDGKKYCDYASSQDW
jgi:hypothetical protein